MVNDKFYSHYENKDNNKELKQHLINVSERARDNVPISELSDLVYICGRVHDIGKYDPLFQEAMKNDEDTDVNHAPFGSICTYYILKDRDFCLKNKLIGLLSVYCHHMSLPNKNKISDHIDERLVNNSNRISYFKDKIKRIEKNESAEKEIKDLFESLDSSWECFKEDIFNNDLGYIEEDYKVSGGIFNDPSIQDSINYQYSHLLAVWSTLNFSDKSDAMKLNRITNYNSPNKENLNTYLDNLPNESDLDKLRSKVSDSVYCNTKEFMKDDKDVATINLPTGMGKTLTGIRAALNMADDSSNIIYTLPYTSIIDQTSDLLSDIYDDKNILVHHYLSETKVEDDDLTKKQHKAFLGKTWNSNFILTTFVQLFESIVGPSNYQSMKINNIKNSVIILDEIQSLPYTWWNLIYRVAQILVMDYNCKIISMTATEPYIFTKKNINSGNERELKTEELVDEPEKYFERNELQRVHYHFHNSFWSGVDKPHITYEEASKIIINDFKNFNNSMVICNTIDSSRKLTEKLENKLTDYKNLNKYLEEEEKTNIDYLKDNKWIVNLTSRHRPKDRLLIINKLKKLLEKDTDLILISTQIIEAGVDISFNAVYRDLAPIDKIVQAAGRCNRENKNKKGKITIFSLEDKRGKSIASKIYKNNQEYNLINPTIQSCKEIIGNNTSKTQQKKVNYDCVRKYYELLKNRSIGKQEYTRYIDKVNTLKLNKLKIIDNDYKTCDIVIPLNNNEKQNINNIRKHFNNKNFEKMKKEKKEIKDITISIPLYTKEEEQKIQQLPKLIKQEKNSLYRVVDRNNENYYTSKFGFKIPENTICGRIR